MTEPSNQLTDETGNAVTPTIANLRAIEKQDDGGPGLAADDTSMSSFSTLLSELDDSDDEDEQKQAPLVRLRKSFAERNELLAEICQGKDEGQYAVMLYEAEYQVRRLALEKYEKLAMKKSKDNDDDDDLNRQKIRLEKLRATAFEYGPIAKAIKKQQQQQQNTTEEATTHTQASSVDTIENTTLFHATKARLMFEIRHTIPAATSLCFYCFFHSSIYEIIDTILCDVFGSLPDQNVVRVGMIVFGILLSRLCGDLWNNWQSPKLYKATKFHLHNQLRLQTWDARLLRWFNHRPQFQAACGYLAFYLAWIAVFEFYHLLIRFCLDQKEDFLQRLPSKAYENVTTWVSNRLANDIELVTEEEDHVCLTSGLDIDSEVCSLQEQLEEMDLSFLSSRASQASFATFVSAGLEKEPLVHFVHNMLFHIMVAMITMWMMSKGLGVNPFHW